MPREQINCQNCKFWGFDMDMDAFCTHPNSGPFGTVLRAMRGETKTENMRGEPCGPQAKLFEQGTSLYAQKEKHASESIV